MHFSTDQEDTTTVFRLKEERLDSQNAGQLKAEFLILAQPDVDTLIIDLSEVRHVDSAGLSALLLAERQMTAHAGDVRLVGVNDDVLSLLRVTQFDRIFPIFNTVDEALDAEPSFGDEEDEEDIPLGAPGAPSVNQIKAGRVSAGGSLGAAALAKIMMSPYEDNLEELNILAFGDEDIFDDDDDDDDELDDDLEPDEDDLDEIEEIEKPEEIEEIEEIEEDDLLEDDDLEDDDFDEEELEEDEEEDI